MRAHVVEQLRDKARPGVLTNRDAFDHWLAHALPGDRFVTRSLRTLLREAFGARDPLADICRDSAGKPESDSTLRDFENVPLAEDIDAYFAREVLPHVSDSWMDRTKDKVGYEMNFNRHFFAGFAMPGFWR